MESSCDMSISAADPALGLRVAGVRVLTLTF